MNWFDCSGLVLEQMLEGVGYLDLHRARQYPPEGSRRTNPVRGRSSHAHTFICSVLTVPS